MAAAVAAGRVGGSAGESKGIHTAYSVAELAWILCITAREGEGRRRRGSGVGQNVGGEGDSLLRQRAARHWPLHPSLGEIPIIVDSPRRRSLAPHRVGDASMSPRGAAIRILIGSARAGRQRRAGGEGTSSAAGASSSSPPPPLLSLDPPSLATSDPYTTRPLGCTCRLLPLQLSLAFEPTSLVGGSAPKSQEGSATRKVFRPWARKYWCGVGG